MVQIQLRHVCIALDQRGTKLSTSKRDGGAPAAAAEAAARCSATSRV
jgi:hypothetical protein